MISSSSSIKFLGSIYSSCHILAILSNLLKHTHILTMSLCGGGDNGWVWVTVAVSCGWRMTISATDCGESRMAGPQSMKEKRNIWQIKRCLI
ncbi:hypothetical protein J0A68_22710, partial [Algoriphagus sp. H41]